MYVYVYSRVCVCVCVCALCPCQSPGLTLVSMRRLQRLRLSLAELCLATLEQLHAEDEVRARQAKTSAQRVLEEFTCHTPEPGSLDQVRLTRPQIHGVVSHARTHARTHAHTAYVLYRGELFVPLAVCGKVSLHTRMKRYLNELIEYILRVPLITFSH